MRKTAWVLLAAVLIGGCAGAIHSVKPEGELLCLTLKAPEAGSVSLLSSARGYSALPAVRNADGLWEVRVRAQGPFDYFYLVDDQPYTPPCRFSRPDGFGGRTCIYHPAP